MKQKRKDHQGKRVGTEQRNVKKELRADGANSMRKQELKSRKKVHARKRKKKGSHARAYGKKETTTKEYRPEVITLEKIRKRTK